MTTLPHDSIKTARDQTLDLIGLNHAQRALLANATPGRDSILEHLQYWRSKYSITDTDWIACGLQLGEVVTLNDREYLGERQIAGSLDDLASVAHRHAARPMSFKDLADALREALLVMDAPAGRSADALIAARRAVTDIVAITPSNRLRSDTLRHELRPTAHDVLLALLDGASA